MGRKKKYTTEEERKAAKMESARKYRENNREKCRESSRKWIEKDRKEKIEKYKEELKKWRNNNAEHIKEYNKVYKKTKSGRASYLVTGYKKGDKKHNRGECTLTAKWVVDNIFTSKCRYCKKDDWRKLGCDRIDNSKPHTPDNVVPCCEDCNKKRGTKPFEEFLKEMQQKMLEEFENQL